ncbi:MAG: FAD-dependent oxidoreductase [Ignavibacteriaceae bacterium]
MMQHLVIIGNGITGITTARFVRKYSNMRITIISDESKYFFSRTALMYVYMGHMKWENIKPYEDWFYEKNRIELLYHKVIFINTNEKKITLDNNDFISYDKLVIATGSKTNKFGWPGRDLPGVQGLYSKQDLELLEENTKNIERAVIVGGGLIGIELGEMLLSRNIHVTFLVREKFYWGSILPKEEASMVGRHIVEHGMNLELETELKEIISGSNGRVKAILTTKGEEIACQFVGLTPGVHPNIDLLINSGIKTARGVLVNEYLETNIQDVYSAGDCAEIITTSKIASDAPAPISGRVEQLWYTGKMQAEILARNILGEKIKYNRGIWYNSAKFLDIEYQTYGFVANVPADGEDSFFWEHASGKICIRLVYSKMDKVILGVNAFGIRLRHTIFENWIKQKKTVEFVLENLRAANFDPEFYMKYENEILGKYNQQNPAAKLVIKKKFVEMY